MKNKSYLDSYISTKQLGSVL